ncbi:hypothetical protein ABC347_15865 [Sphingomonas sp. 1P06PA]|uniref:hypothetical protein n=1 Tax=Sphingomonas sp. 1P06PA TaxID=554121 RepID=UPI0039A48801
MIAKTTKALSNDEKFSTSSNSASPIAANSRSTINNTPGVRSNAVAWTIANRRCEIIDPDRIDTVPACKVAVAYPSPALTARH